MYLCTCCRIMSSCFLAVCSLFYSKRILPFGSKLIVKNNFDFPSFVILHPVFPISVHFAEEESEGFKSSIIFNI